MRDRLNLRREFHFLGRRMDTPCIFSALATYVHPSEAEAVSMAVMEAAASGRPVVASRVGGIPEVVRDGETGILVPPRSAEAIAQAVLKLLRAPEAAREMGKRGARIIDESFSLRACIHAHRQVYCDACDESL